MLLVKHNGTSFQLDRFEKKAAEDVRAGGFCFSVALPMRCTHAVLLPSCFRSLARAGESVLIQIHTYLFHNYAFELREIRFVKFFKTSVEQAQIQIIL